MHSMIKKFRITFEFFWLLLPIEGEATNVVEMSERVMVTVEF